MFFSFLTIASICQVTIYMRPYQVDAPPPLPPRVLLLSTAPRHQSLVEQLQSAVVTMITADLAISLVEDGRVSVRGRESVVVGGREGVTGRR